MGNDEEIKKENYYLDVNLIGYGNRNINALFDIIRTLKVKNINKLVSQKNEEDLLSLFDYWDYQYNFKKNFKSQSDDIFYKFQSIKKRKQLFKSCLIVKVNHPDSEEVEYILEKINELEDKDYMPLVLFLCDYKIEFSEEDYPNIEKRMILTEKYIPSHNFEGEENPIIQILIKFCSIFNELGDKFTVGKGDKISDYCLKNKLFPFNLNIICIGRIRQGKSTCVNFILNEMRARETNSGISQTKKMTYYQVINYPIKILDAPGFENEDTVSNAVNELKMLNDKLEKIKDKLHIILYVIDFQSTVKFIEDEILIFSELINHNEAKVIYVFTKASKMKRKQKNVIEKTQESIDKLLNINKNWNEKNLILIKEKMKISEENSVFVNFIGDEDCQKHGVKELFKKINFFFKKTESYNLAFNRNNEREAQILKERAREEMLSYKIAGGLIGIIPIVDFLVQKFYIKKKALNAIAQIFGLDIDELEKYEKKKLEDEDISDKIGNAGKSLLSTAGNIGGSALVVNGSGEAVKIVTTTLLKETSYIKFFSWELFKKTTTTVIDTSSTVARIGVDGVKIGIGIGLSALMSVVGIGLGAYFTTRDLNAIIDKFYEIYKVYGPVLVSSYFRAVDYLETMELNN